MGGFKWIRDGIIRMMYGRNGMDQLNLVLVWCGLIVTILSSLLRRHHFLGNVLSGLSTVILLVALFRLFSRNLYKRREENSRFLNLRWKWTRRWKDARERHADTAHKYFTCPSCKTICRVPAGKGRVEITCPGCGGKIRGKT